VKASDLRKGMLVRLKKGACAFTLGEQPNLELIIVPNRVSNFLHTNKQYSAFSTDCMMYIGYKPIKVANKRKNQRYFLADSLVYKLKNRTLRFLEPAV